MEVKLLPWFNDIALWRTFMRLEIAILCAMTQVGPQKDCMQPRHRPHAEESRRVNHCTNSEAAIGSDAEATAIADASLADDGGWRDGATEVLPGSDAGALDAGMTDASWGDAGAVDAEAVDGGEEVDGGTGGECGALIRVEKMPSSGYLAQFRDGNEYAHVWVTSTAGIVRIEEFLTGQRSWLGVPGGPIELNGEYNPGYSYRMIPDKIHFGEFWVDVCDAPPCYVEKNAAAWVQRPKTWCPWAFQVEEIWDCRAAAQDGTCRLVYSKQTAAIRRGSSTRQ
jgi:hypothetical protein